MHLRRIGKEDMDRTCLVCKRREGDVRIRGGYVCRYCIPVRSGFDGLSAEDIAAGHMKDRELLDRVDSFVESGSYGDLRFDDEHELFFKGPWPSYFIPILSYSEIVGYRAVIDGDPIAFDSVDGKRALFKACTDEYIRGTCKKIDSIILELDSSRSNVRFSPYTIRKGMSGVCDSKEGCFRLAISISRKLDSIVENNIASGVKKQSDNNQPN